MHDHVSVYRASTQGLQGKAELEQFLEDFGRTILRIEMSPLEGIPLTCHSIIRRLGDVDLAMGEMSPIRNYHPSELGDDGLVLAVLQQGSATLERKGQSTKVGKGEAVLTHNADSATFVGHTPSRVANLRLKRDLLALHLPQPEVALGRPVPEQHFGVRLLLDYCARLADETLRLGPNEARLASEHIYDLVGLALSGSSDPRPHMRGIGAARLLALQTDILRSLGDPSLSIGTIARRHGISASYARRLFATDGTSFAHYVLEQRLLQAHRLLSDPRNRHRSIASIAYEVGFGDLSYFNRSFRQRYGCTPSDVRD